MLILMTMVLGTQSAKANEFTRPDLRIIVDNEVIDSNSELIDGRVFIPVRMFAEKFGARVTWLTDINRVLIISNNSTIAPTTFLKNGTAMMDVNYVNRIFGHKVERLEDINAVSISTRGQSFDRNRVGSIFPSFNGYTEEDLFWLSRIIFAEARGEPFEGMLAVGSVVMNRTKHPQYPDTVRGVIFDRKNGIQFSPTANGSINNTPSTISLIAAIEVLEGKRNASGALFFMNPSIARSSWISNNRQHAFTMQNHAFFY